MELDYVQLFLRSSHPEASTFSILALCFLAAGRIAPIIVLTPFFGSRILPNPVKMVITILFICMMLPKLITSMHEPLVFNLDLMILMGRELLIGTIFGFFLGLPFLVVSATGVYIDHQRGAASLMVNDPTIQNQSSPIGTLYNLMLICLFWSINGPFRVLDILSQSYDLLPADTFQTPVFLHERGFVHQTLLHIPYSFASMSLQLAVPSLLVILMTDTFLGIINRLAPQVQISFLGMGLKSWLTLLIVCLGLSPFFDYMTKLLLDWLEEFEYLVQHFNVYTPKGLEPKTFPF